MDKKGIIIILISTTIFSCKSNINSKTDFHFGLGWGAMDGSSNNFKNPLSHISDEFINRPSNTEDMGGQFQPSRYFSGETTSPFFGISHVLSDKLIMKVEYETTLVPGLVGYEEPQQDFSFGFEYSLTKNFSIGFSSERGNSTSIRFTYKNDSKVSRPKYEYSSTSGGGSRSAKESKGRSGGGRMAKHDGQCVNTGISSKPGQDNH